MPDSWSTNSVFKSTFTSMTFLFTAPLPGILFCVLFYSHMHKALSITFRRNFTLDGSLVLTLPLIKLHFSWWNKLLIYLPLIFIIMVSAALFISLYNLTSSATVTMETSSSFYHLAVYQHVYYITLSRHN
jgi:hypothetical protein